MEAEAGVSPRAGAHPADAPRLVMVASPGRGGSLAVRGWQRAAPHLPVAAPGGPHMDQSLKSPMASTTSLSTEVARPPHQPGLPSCGLVAQPQWIASLPAHAEGWRKGGASVLDLQHPGAMAVGSEIMGRWE
jgi:hypothetical protein